PFVYCFPCSSPPGLLTSCLTGVPYIRFHQAKTLYLLATMSVSSEVLSTGNSTLCHPLTPSPPHRDTLFLARPYHMTNHSKPPLFVCDTLCHKAVVCCEQDNELPAMRAYGKSKTNGTSK